MSSPDDRPESRSESESAEIGLAERLAVVGTSIERACERVGRDPAEVRLLPVSKTFPAARVRDAYAAGVRMVGENKVQELAGKADELADLPDLGWAMIGHLQRNKVRDVVAHAAEFHALDSLRLAEALHRRLEAADRTLDVFCEVNSSGEDSKFGAEPAAVIELARGLSDFPRLRPRGLMTIAANTDDRDRVAGCFRTVAELARRLREDDRVDGSYQELSMGMSGDYELAIEYGATTVRIGSAIFGARPAP